MSENNTVKLPEVLVKQKALLQLMTKLAEAKVSVREEGTISADDLEKELGLFVEN